MNRIEMVGLFTAMTKLMEEKKYEAAEEVMRAVLREAVTKDKRADKEGDKK